MEPLITGRSTKELRIRKRDRELLSYLGQNPFAPVAILRELFFDNREDQSDYRRLKQLSRKGLIEALPSDGMFQIRYRLTGKGERLLKALGIQTVFQGRKKNYGIDIIHDTHLLSVRKLLEAQLCISNYYGEREVRSLLGERHGFQGEKEERYKVPDALFTLRLPDRTIRVALELERTSKSQKRIKRQFELLGASSDFESTFWVAGSDKILARLVQILSDLRKNNFRFKTQSKSHGFYFTTLNELLSKKGDAVFSGEDTTFSLSRLQELS